MLVIANKREQKDSNLRFLDDGNQTVAKRHTLTNTSLSYPLSTLTLPVLPLCFTSDGNALVPFAYLSLSRTRTASSYQTSTNEQNRTAFRARVRIYTLHVSDSQWLTNLRFSCD